MQGKDEADGRDSEMLQQKKEVETHTHGKINKNMKQDKSYSKFC